MIWTVQSISDLVATPLWTVWAIINPVTTPTVRTIIDPVTASICACTELNTWEPSSLEIIPD